MQTQEFQNRLRELREAAGEDTWQVGALVGRSTWTISRWESGKYPIPQDAMPVLARHYGVSVEHLMGWDEAAA